MRARLSFLVVSALASFCAVSALGCEHTALIRLLDARLSRAADGHVIADVELEGVDTGGGNVGNYCVSVAFFAGTFDGNREEIAHYPDALDQTPDVCDDDLSDGDRRTVRLTSTTTTLAVGLPARAQVWQFDAHESANGPVVVKRFVTMQGLFTP